MAVLYGAWRAAFAFDVGGWTLGVPRCVLCCVVSCAATRRLLRAKSCWSCGGFGGGGERERERRRVLLAMGTELAPGIVCCASLCGSLGVPHHVAPWEQHRNGSSDPVKQVRKLRVFSFCVLLDWRVSLDEDALRNSAVVA